MGARRKVALGAPANKEAERIAIIGPLARARLLPNGPTTKTRGKEIGGDKLRGRAGARPATLIVFQFVPSAYLGRRCGRACCVI